MKFHTGRIVWYVPAGVANWRWPAAPFRAVPALIVAALLLAVTPVVQSDPPTSPQVRLVAAGQYRSEARGLDSCNAPTHSQMEAFWSDSPWWWWGIYIGGSAMGCANTNVTASWITQETNRGWRLLPTWVGPQASCSSFASRMPANTSDAYDKGYDVAANAFAHATASGELNMTAANLPIAYDLEGWTSSDAGCLNAAKAFMRGWTAYLHLGTAQKAGLYGSAGASKLDDFWSISPNPDFIWAARYDGNSDTGALTPYIAASHWGSVRHKQFDDNVSRTRGGYTLAVDLNCSAGPVYGTADTYSDPDCS